MPLLRYTFVLIQKENILSSALDRLKNLTNKISGYEIARKDNLIILQNLDVLESEGRRGHVFYSLSKNPPADMMRAVKLFI